MPRANPHEKVSFETNFCGRLPQIREHFPNGFQPEGPCGALQDDGMLEILNNQENLQVHARESGMRVKDMTFIGPRSASMQFIDFPGFLAALSFRSFWLVLKPRSIRARQWSCAPLPWDLQMVPRLLTSQLLPCFLDII